MDDLPEWKTRLEKIDVQLLNAGWHVKDKYKVRIEIDTKQSDFVKKIFKDLSETLKDDDERTDYLISNWLRNRHTIEFLGLMRKVGDKSIVVPLTEIKENDYILSGSRYRELAHEDIEYDDLKEILRE